MRRLMLIAGLAGLLLHAGSARADDDRPPRYDTDGLCMRLANTNDGFVPEALQSCLRDQGDALDYLTRIWETTPPYILSGCDEQTRTSDDYGVLEICIRQQMSQNSPNLVSPRLAVPSVGNPVATPAGNGTTAPDIIGAPGPGQ
jgi:hypothetical protein